MHAASMDVVLFFAQCAFIDAHLHLCMQTVNEELLEAVGPFVLHKAIVLTDKPGVAVARTVALQLPPAPAQAGQAALFTTHADLGSTSSTKVLGTAEAMHGRSQSRDSQGVLDVYGSDLEPGPGCQASSTSIGNGIGASISISRSTSSSSRHTAGGPVFVLGGKAFDARGYEVPPERLKQLACIGEPGSIMVLEPVGETPIPSGMFQGTMRGSVANTLDEGCSSSSLVGVAAGGGGETPPRLRR